MKKGRKITLWVLGVIVVLFIIGVIWRTPHVLEQRKAEETISFIQSQKITLDDVTGANLPPTPDPALVDATIEGIDANGNGIRDDVELAIFERYPTDLKIRAAMLQYAMALQLELDNVFDRETWTAATRQIGRGFGCVYDSLEGANPNSVSVTTEVVEGLVRNTKGRQDKYESLNNLQTSFSLSDQVDCDVSFE